MAAELQPPEGPITTAAATTTTATNHATKAVAATTTGIEPAQPEYLAPPPSANKRQRRPSVRLGEIGDQAATISYESHVRRTKQPWRVPKESSKSVKARSLSNLSHFDLIEVPEAEANAQNGELNLEFSHRKKVKRVATKRVRSSWMSKVDDGAGGVDGDSRDDGDEGFRDFDPDSGSPLKSQSPVNSVDNVGLDSWHRHRRTVASRARVSESRGNDAMEMDNLRESDSRDQKYETSEGVRTWLIELGLSRYAPVFEIHEVDDEVLPLLTLEDLKDMGINAVGSRRKLYSAIQKLRKGFSQGLKVNLSYEDKETAKFKRIGDKQVKDTMQ